MLNPKDVGLGLRKEETLNTIGEFLLSIYHRINHWLLSRF